MYNGTMTTLALLDNGADVNAQDVYGQTALMNAVGDDNIDVAEILMSRGANPTLMNNNGKTAAEQAINMEVKKWLEEAAGGV